MKINRFLFTCLVSSAIGLSFGCSEIKNMKEVDEFQKTTRKYLVDDFGLKDGNRWFAYGEDANRIVWELIDDCESVQDQKLKVFAESFERHGGNSNLRWFVIAPDMFLVNRSGPERVIDGVSVKANEFRDKYRKLQIRFAFWQVKWFCENRSALASYCRLLLYSGMQFSLDVDRYWFLYRSRLVLKQLEDSESDAFWYYARELIVLLEMTGKMDYLSGAQKRQIMDSADQWGKWLEINSKKLIPQHGSHVLGLAENDTDIASESMTIDIEGLGCPIDDCSVMPHFDFDFDKFIELLRGLQRRTFMKHYLEK